MNNKIFGFGGESIAARYLKKHGYKILNKNYRQKSFEIDIIAFKNNTLIFVEVKTRSTTKFGLPCESVDFRKQKKIQSGANAYLANFDGDCDVRFDIIEVYADRKSDMILGAKINHIKNAF